MVDGFLAARELTTFDIFGTVLGLTGSLGRSRRRLPGSPWLRDDGPSVLRRLAGTAAH